MPDPRVTLSGHPAQLGEAWTLDVDEVSQGGRRPTPLLADRRPPPTVEADETGGDEGRGVRRVTVLSFRRGITVVTIRTAPSRPSPFISVTAKPAARNASADEGEATGAIAWTATVPMARRCSRAAPTNVPRAYPVA